MIQFTIDPNGLPYYQQLRDQIIRAIESGQLQPGDKLPTLQEVSEKFGVSKNTGIRAYQELERAGWVKMTRKTGTLVQIPSPQPTEMPGQIPKAMTLIQQALALLFEAGTSADHVNAALARIISERWSPDYSESDCVVLVQDEPFNVEEDLADVERVTGLRARWVPIREVMEFGEWALGDTRRIKAILAVFYRFAQVRDRLGSLPLTVLPISVTTDPLVAQKAVQYNRPDMRIAIIATDAVFFVPLEVAIQQFLFNAAVIGKAILSEEQQVRELVERADLIVGNYWLTDPRGVSDITKGKPVIPLGTRADPGSLQLVKETLASDRLQATLPGG